MLLAGARRVSHWNKVAALLLIIWIEFVSSLSIQPFHPQRNERHTDLASPITTTTASSTWMRSHRTNHSHLQKSFQHHGGFLYKSSVLTHAELTIIKSEMAQLCLQAETTSSVARNRIGAIVPREFDTVRILQEGSVMDLIQTVAGSDYKLSTDIPVELRAYAKPGAGMDWHVDDVLYQPSPQLEVVLTLENTSDCRTMLKLPGSTDNVQIFETDVNSSLIILAGGIPHCVTSLKYGKRTILKCAYVDPSATFLQNDMVDQFVNSKGKRKKKRK